MSFLRKLSSKKNKDSKGKHKDGKEKNKHSNDNNKTEVKSPSKTRTNHKTSFSKIEDNYKTYEDLQYDLRKKGFEASQLIIGIDYTKSNTWNGEKTFNNKCLHDLTTINPYQQAIEIIGRTLEPFDDDNKIPVYGFGDKTTTDKDVFPFFPDNRPCNGFREVIERYNQLTPYIQLNGPTNFAPLIYKTIEIVKATGEYHILVIIADGEVSRPKETEQAIVDASNYPISIIMVGVGDGPWDKMEEYDDELSQRKFDNFQFVNFHEVMIKKKVENHDIEFAKCAMMEIPEQYQAIKTLGLLEKISTANIQRSPTYPIIYPQTSFNSLPSAPLNY